MNKIEFRSGSQWTHALHECGGDEPLSAYFYAEGGIDAARAEAAEAITAALGHTVSEFDLDIESFELRVSTAAGAETARIKFRREAPAYRDGQHAHGALGRGDERMLRTVCDVLSLGHARNIAQRVMARAHREIAYDWLGGFDPATGARNTIPFADCELDSDGASGECQRIEYRDGSAIVVRHNQRFDHRDGSAALGRSGGGCGLGVHRSWLDAGHAHIKNLLADHEIVDQAHVVMASQLTADERYAQKAPVGRRSVAAEAMGLMPESAYADNPELAAERVELHVGYLLTPVKTGKNAGRGRVLRDYCWACFAGHPERDRGVLSALLSAAVRRSPRINVGDDGRVVVGGSS